MARGLIQSIILTLRQGEIKKHYNMYLKYYSI